VDAAHLHRQLEKLVEALETLGLEGLHAAPDAEEHGVEGLGTIDMLPGQLYVSQTTHVPSGSPAGFALGKKLVDALTRDMLPPGAEPGDDDLMECFDEAATALVEAWNRDGDEADALNASGADVVTTRLETRRDLVQQFSDDTLTMASQPLLLNEDWLWIFVFGPVGWVTDNAITWREAVATLDAIEGVVTPLDDEAEEVSESEGGSNADAEADARDITPEPEEPAHWNTQTTDAEESDAGKGDSKPKRDIASAMSSGAGVDAALVLVDESGAFRKWFFEQIRLGNLSLVPAEGHEVTCGGQAAVVVVGPHHCAIPVHSEHIFTIAKAS